MYPEKQLAYWSAIRFTADHILDYIQLDSDYGIFEISVPEKWIGKTVQEADVRRKHGINIMGFRRNGEIDLEFTPDTKFKNGDNILILGKTKDMQKTFHI